jgi:adenylylsulfate kinase-like enzyme
MNIFPEYERFLSRHDKEALLGQTSMVVWLYGLSGSGKSTIANAVERILHQQGRMTTILDGDNFRTGLNVLKTLGVSLRLQKCLFRMGSLLSFLLLPQNKN